MCNVLVIDDDSASITLIALVLRRAGYDVYSANNAVEGFELAHHVRPNIILLNDGMPHMSGGELCARIKNSRVTAAIPVVLVSAGPRIEDPIYIKNSGADGVLRKPYMPNDLLNIISTHAINPAACR